VYFRSEGGYSAPTLQWLKRFLQRQLETRIGRALVADSIPAGSRLSTVIEKGALAIWDDQSRPSMHRWWRWH